MWGQKRKLTKISQQLPWVDCKPYPASPAGLLETSNGGGRGGGDRSKLAGTLNRELQAGGLGRGRGQVSSCPPPVHKSQRPGLTPAPRQASPFPPTASKPNLPSSRFPSLPLPTLTSEDDGGGEKENKCRLLTCCVVHIPLDSKHQ